MLAVLLPVQQIYILLRKELGSAYFSSRQWFLKDKTWGDIEWLVPAVKNVFCDQAYGPLGQNGGSGAYCLPTMSKVRFIPSAMPVYVNLTYPEDYYGEQVP